MSDTARLIAVEAKLALLEAEHRALRDFTLDLLSITGFQLPAGVGLFRTAVRKIGEDRMPAPGKDDPYADALAKLLGVMESRITPAD
ncbi:MULTISPECIES: hypothetical protein [Brevundimonas]|uniref:hypothetical protein n=1 Tax=Brevundimonas sp. UBA7507 TaxID=1946137 RepID=UPI00257D03A1|nr:MULTISPECIES: hypothetical protein [Brevundimonas]